MVSLKTFEHTIKFLQNKQMDGYGKKDLATSAAAIGKFYIHWTILGWLHKLYDYVFYRH